ncbi:MAG: thioredoxin family protein [Bryobacteraceae bacterium]|jgi:thiol-disulfide isomerase/thioredoxin
MKSSPRALLIAAGVLTLSRLANASFAPFEAWKVAVIAGDKAAMSRLYSSNPPALAKLGGDQSLPLAEELQFWADLKSAGVTEVNAKVLQISQGAGRARLLLRVEAVKSDQPVEASMVQLWVQQSDGWRIAATGRTAFSPSPTRRLPQPATPNPELYPEPGAAQAQLSTAETNAAKQGKRLLVVFGANWCYDCHVLDTTFHSPSFARLVDDNYVVVHINIGDEGKDNHDLADRLGVALNRGIPSLAVLNPDGTVLVAQKNGEFESTVKIGPEEVRDFLEKWKPARP